MTTATATATPTPTVRQAAALQFADLAERACEAAEALPGWTPGATTGADDPDPAEAERLARRLVWAADALLAAAVRAQPRLGVIEEEAQNCAYLRHD
jgi:hypothetical protein